MEKYVILIILIVGGDFVKNIDEYKTNPIHRRTVKLFRWHLDKQTECTIEELEKVLLEFHKKYDVSGDDFYFPILVALTNSLEEIDFIPFVHKLGKDRIMDLLDKYLQTNKQ